MGSFNGLYRRAQPPHRERSLGCCRVSQDSRSLSCHPAVPMAPKRVPEPHRQPPQCGLLHNDSEARQTGAHLTPALWHRSLNGRRGVNTTHSLLVARNSPPGMAMASKSVSTATSLRSTSATRFTPREHRTCRRNERVFTLRVCVGVNLPGVGSPQTRR